MSREVRRVPIGWKHPVEHNPHWEFQQSTPYGRTKPSSRLHGPTERFVSLCADYPGVLARWEQEGRELAERAGHSWEFSLRWHFTGYDDCTCHPGETDVRHPVYGWDDRGETEIVLAIHDVDALHAHLMAEHERQRPDPNDYMPVFDVPAGELGWCLYQTVSEGTPVTPVFATADELVEHLATVGQDWDQVPMRREAAETLVSQGYSLGSFVVTGSTLLKSDTDADLIAEAVTS